MSGRRPLCRAQVMAGAPVRLEGTAYAAAWRKTLVPVVIGMGAATPAGLLAPVQTVEALGRWAAALPKARADGYYLAPALAGNRKLLRRALGFALNQGFRRASIVMLLAASPRVMTALFRELGIGGLFTEVEF